MQNLISNLEFLPGNLALTPVSDHAAGSVPTMIFGCREDVNESITAHIENSEDRLVHPKLMFGNLVELEMEQRAELVYDQVYHFVARVH